MNDEMREELPARARHARARPRRPRRRADRRPGKGFCTGADLSGAARGDRRRRRRRIPARRATRMRPSQRLIRALWELEKPIIAAVNGVAAGLGAHLAFACDLVIAADDARFIEVFVRRGIAIDAGGAFLLPRHVGLAQGEGAGRSSATTCRRQDAERLGLVNRVVPADRAGAGGARMGERLAPGPTFAIGISKRLLNRSLQSRPGHLLRRGGVHAGAGRPQRGHEGRHTVLHGEAAAGVQRALDRGPGFAHGSAWALPW